MVALAGFQRRHHARDRRQQISVCDLASFAIRNWAAATGLLRRICRMNMPGSLARNSGWPRISADRSISASAAITCITKRRKIIMSSSIRSRVGGCRPGFTGAPFRHTQWVPGVSDNHQCLACRCQRVRHVYPDPNQAGPGFWNALISTPIRSASLNNQGHNYFLSQNPYMLNSYAGVRRGLLQCDLRFEIDRRFALDG